MIRSFFKGVFDPIRAVTRFIFQNPAKAALYLGASVFALSRFPVLSLGLSAGILAGGAYQVTSGLFGVAKSLARKDNEQVNAACERVGRGTFNVALSGPSAIRQGKTLKQTLDNLYNTAAQTTSLQKALIFLHQRTQPLNPTELSRLPATWGQLGNHMKQTFLGFFNPDNVALQEGAHLKSATQSVASNAPKIQEFLQRHASIPGASKAAEYLSALPMDPGTLNALPGIADALQQDPQLINYLALLLEGEDKVNTSLKAFEDLKNMIEEGSSKTALASTAAEGSPPEGEQAA